MQKEKQGVEGKSMLDGILALLPGEPRSFDTSDAPGFWSDGSEILCLSETDCEIVAVFLRDLLKNTGIDVHTGYYDPLEDAQNGEQDDHTGFHYIDFD